MPSDAQGGHLAAAMPCHAASWQLLAVRHPSRLCYTVMAVSCKYHSSFGRYMWVAYMCTHRGAIVCHSWLCLGRGSWCCPHMDNTQRLGRLFADGVFAAAGSQHCQCWKTIQQHTLQVHKTQGSNRSCNESQTPQHRPLPIRQSNLDLRGHLCAVLVHPTADWSKHTTTW
jgi:hypothetical protein